MTIIVKVFSVLFFLLIIFFWLYSLSCTLTKEIHILHYIFITLLFLVCVFVYILGSLLYNIVFGSPLKLFSNCYLWRIPPVTIVLLVGLLHYPISDWRIFKFFTSENIVPWTILNNFPISLCPKTSVYCSIPGVRNI